MECSVDGLTTVIFPCMIYKNTVDKVRKNKNECKEEMSALQQEAGGGKRNSNLP